MTIQDNPSAGSVQPNGPRSDGPDQAQEAAQSDGVESSETSSTDEASRSDRVEISEEARAAQSELGDNAALIERGRAELKSSSLSEERLTELRENVENGRYTESDVTEQVAQGLADDLSRPTPGAN
ncbi:MAG: hypothetical protein BRD30_11010 [Bacteroidetes bacterium QH_2_63_10]|jgi:anti-sigma28 factor (negative regulator of flagellin synthesis)|nr:MAG: hypothetical protein BRD35_06040 [Bacteroidetes bacterium QH_7_62_13]PSQ85121.1 MAG: hypothetical protein BRD30_11010 [Bacteroidetes bacterium QH_2_63_10]